MVSNDGTLYDRGYRYTHLDAPGATIIRSTAARLVRLDINSPAPAGLVNMYNASGVATDHLIASVGASGIEQCGSLEFDVVLSGGLTVSVAGSPDVTVIYR